MSNMLDEVVPPVNPLSIKAIEELGSSFLANLVPEMLIKPQPLNVLGLMDSKLPQYGIHVCPATREEIGNNAGLTDPNGEGEITILVNESIWEDLEKSAPISHYARTTVCHEIGHAVLHVPVLRRKFHLTGGLARVQRKYLKPFEDPEWQAWTFAGSILMPRISLFKLKRLHLNLTPSLVSQTFEVSESMAQSHLRKLKLIK